MGNRLTWADHHIFKHGSEQLVFGVEDASLFALSNEAHQTLCRWRTTKSIDPGTIPVADRETLEGLCEARLLNPLARQKLPSPRAEPGCTALATLVLEVAQNCNLNCSYCYAEAGTYGAAPRLMPPETARQAVHYLLDNCGGHQQVTLILFGGEPLMNLPAVKAAILEAHEYGGKLDKKVHVSLTTNGTLLKPDVIDFLHEHRVSVAVSIDGPSSIHDRNRPDKKGRGSYAQIASRLEMLFENAPLPIAARVTLVPDQWQAAVEVFEHLIGLGFDEVGIAPVSPINPSLLPSAEQEDDIMQSFTTLAGRFLDAAVKGHVLPFSNILDLLARLHSGQAKAISCGAGYGYMAVDARGQFFPCHRMAGEPGFSAGDLTAGIDVNQLRVSLGHLNHNRDEDCSTCWARTLCSGGCHYENHLRENQLGLPRGTSCKFIRNWLELGIQTYASLCAAGAMDAMNPLLNVRAQC